jgi:hypothetical protein
MTFWLTTRHFQVARALSSWDSQEVPSAALEGAHDALEALMSEIARYLAAVDLFRECGFEPRWQPESE